MAKNCPNYDVIYGGQACMYPQGCWAVGVCAPRKECYIIMVFIGTDIKKIREDSRRDREKERKLQ